jgi:glycosyltransferase involved in cell wall biosynthesis
VRVGLALPAFLPATGYGGPVWNTLRVARALVGAGVESVLLTSTQSGPGRAELPPGPDVVEGLQIERMPVRWTHGWSPWVRWSAPARPVDVLHVFGLWNGLSYSAMRWASRAGVPWVWEPSGMLPPLGRKALVKRALTPWHLRLGCRAAGLIWTAPQERDEAPVGFRELRHWLRPNPAPEPEASAGVERREARARLGFPADGPLWGYLGRVARRKGIETLLEAWRSAGGPGRLCFTGPSEDQRLAAAVRAAGPSVELRPPVTPAERGILLRAYDALVLVPAYGENFGLVVAEAIAAATPAVVSPAVGAGHWLAGHGAVVVDPPEERLREMFRAGTPPRVACSIPEALRAEVVGRLQAQIYRHACGGSSAR